MRANKPKTRAPGFTVQIVHIDGPRCGQIDELNKVRIRVGRNPDSDVMFPRDLRIVSRRHAEIVHFGGRFMLMNLSKNGCLVNGKPAQVKYLEQGDVFTFAEGGPKARFQIVPHADAQEGSYPAQLTSGAGQGSACFTIQFGINIKTLKQNEVSLGSEAECDFVVRSASVLPLHAQLFVHAGQYFLRDLSGAKQTLLNGYPLVEEAPLQIKDVIGLGKKGPRLQYLGAGCFAEVRGQLLPKNR